MEPESVPEGPRCESCRQPAPPCELHAYHGRCEVCFSVSVDHARQCPPLVVGHTGQSVNAAISKDRRRHGGHNY